MVTTLQVDWFIDPDPASLPVWLIALGLEAMFLGSVLQVMRELSGFSDLTALERLVGVSGLGLGYFFITLSVLSAAYEAYAGFLYILFRGVEGVAATHVFYRIYRYVRGGGGTGTTLPRRARHLLITFFVAALAGYLILKGLVGRPVVGGLRFDVTVVYTVTVATLAFLAVRWRYRNVAAETNSGIVLGLALCIAGAQVFGFSLAGDVLLTLIGSVVYSVGFWASAYALWGRALLGDSMGSSGSGGTTT